MGLNVHLFENGGSSGELYMCGIMQTHIYYIVDLFYLEKCDVMITCQVTTLLFFFIYCHLMSLKCTTYWSV
jgi:hypothetical protein